MADADRRFPNKVDRNVYPRPEYAYPNAKISTTYADSETDFPPPQSAPDGAPNVLLVLLDDVGFGWPSAFGGLVDMPTAERLAASGLRYKPVSHDRTLFTDTSCVAYRTEPPHRTHRSDR